MNSLPEKNAPTTLAKRKRPGMESQGALKSAKAPKADNSTVEGVKQGRPSHLSVSQKRKLVRLYVYTNLSLETIRDLIELFGSKQIQTRALQYILKTLLQDRYNQLRPSNSSKRQIRMSQTQDCKNMKVAHDEEPRKGSVVLSSPNTDVCTIIDSRPQSANPSVVISTPVTAATERLSISGGVVNNRTVSEAEVVPIGDSCTGEAAYPTVPTMAKADLGYAWVPPAMTQGQSDQFLLSLDSVLDKYDDPFMGVSADPTVDGLLLCAQSELWSSSDIAAQPTLLKAKDDTVFGPSPPIDFDMVLEPGSLGNMLGCCDPQDPGESASTLRVRSDKSQSSYADTCISNDERSLNGDHDPIKHTSCMADRTSTLRSSPPAQILKTKTPEGTVVCTYYSKRSDEFQGEPELIHHIDIAHRALRKAFVCVDISFNKDVLAWCAVCRAGKRYNTCYNAANHLRRVHFDSKQTRKRKGKLKPAQSRGGERGGIHPPLEICKLWIAEVEESVVPDPRTYDQEAFVDFKPPTYDDNQKGGKMRSPTINKRQPKSVDKVLDRHREIPSTDKVAVSSMLTQWSASTGSCMSTSTSSNLATYNYRPNSNSNCAAEDSQYGSERIPMMEIESVKPSLRPWLVSPENVLPRDRSASAPGVFNGEAERWSIRPLFCDSCQQFREQLGLLDPACLGKLCLPNDISWVDEHGNTMLHVAVLLGACLSTLLDIIRLGVDTNRTNTLGQKFLHLAFEKLNIPLGFHCMKSNIEGDFAHELFTGNSDFGQCDNSSQRSDAPPRMANFLPATNTKDKQLIETIHFSKDHDTVLRLLHEGANVNSRNYLFETPLFLSVKLGQIEITKSLLSHRPNVHARNLMGQGVLAAGESGLRQAKSDAGLYARIIACMTLAIDAGAIAKPSSDDEWEFFG